MSICIRQTRLRCILCKRTNHGRMCILTGESGREVDQFLLSRVSSVPSFPLRPFPFYARPVAANRRKFIMYEPSNGRNRRVAKRTSSMSEHSLALSLLTYTCTYVCIQPR